MVGAVTLNYKTAADTAEAVRALLASDGVEMTVFLVENGSGDGSWEKLSQDFAGEKRVELIRSEVNTGFAGGNNIGIRAALKRGVEFVFLVSSDVIVEPDCARRLTAAMDAHSAASAQPLMLRRGNDMVDTLGHLVRKDMIIVDVGEDQPLPSGIEGQDWEIFGVCAGAAMYRASVFVRLGLLPDDFFIYYEDVDLNFRIRLTGGRAILVPGARARHTRYGSAGGFALKHYYAERNLLAVRIRHYPASALFTKDTALLFKRGAIEAARHHKVREYAVHLARAMFGPRVASGPARRRLVQQWAGVERRPITAGTRPSPGP